MIHQAHPDFRKRQGQDGSLAVPAGHVLLLGAMGAMSQPEGGVIDPFCVWVNYLAKFGGDVNSRDMIWLSMVQYMVKSV